MKINIATRESPLALWQAEHVRDLILKIKPDANVSLVGITTVADKFLETRLQKIGGKGLFVKELEEALLNESCDIAVHSMKDVPYQLPDGLDIVAVLPRHDPSDCMISNKYDSLEALPEGALVGTSSLRRECQLKALRPDLHIEPIRGNVNTRLRKLDEGAFDALIMATAGIERLGFDDRIKHRFTPDKMLPAGGQGIVGIESRKGATEINQLLSELNTDESRICITAERKLNECLGGNCHLPVAAYATINNNSDEKLNLEAAVGSIDTYQVLRASGSDTLSAAEALGESVAAQLLSMGAKPFIEEAQKRI